MANRFNTPNAQFEDQNGLPLIGGKLYFYSSGTSTPLATYSDSALTIPNTNPVILDATGNAGSIFLQNLAYKVILATSADVQIWTEDPVSTSDYTAVAQFQGYNGDPNGHVAGTAASPGIPASVVWDYLDQILYIATQTGDASSTVWTAYDPSSSAGGTGVIPPQGYLTPTSSTPIIPTSVLAATSLFYTPYVGNQIPIYNGTAFTEQTFAELTLTLSASQTGNALFDVFMFNNSSVLTLAAGPAWASSTAGSSSRGTGAGTTQLQRINGIWVNAVSMTGRNGANTYSIGANLATYLGTIYIDPAAGQVSCYRTWVQNAKWGIWNAYNRAPIILQTGDPTASWTYAIATWRPSNGSASNSLFTMCGLPEEIITTSFSQRAGIAGANEIQLGIGVNSTTAPSGQLTDLTTVATQVLIQASLAPARYILFPALGIQKFTALENAIAAATVTMTGNSTFMLLSATYRG